MSKSKPRPPHRYGGRYSDSERYRDGEERISFPSRPYLDMASLERLGRDPSMRWVDGRGRGYRDVTGEETLRLLRTAARDRWLWDNRMVEDLDADACGGVFVVASLFYSGDDRCVLLGDFH